MAEIDLEVYDGKYRFVFDAKGSRAYRYGEPWRDCTGDGFVLALAQDLQEARHQRDELRKALEAVAHDMHQIGRVTAGTLGQLLGTVMALEAPQ